MTHVMYAFSHAIFMQSNTYIHMYMHGKRLLISANHNYNTHTYINLGIFIFFACILYCLHSAFDTRKKYLCKRSQSTHMCYPVRFLLFENVYFSLHYHCTGFYITSNKKYFHVQYTSSFISSCTYITRIKNLFSKSCIQYKNLQIMAVAFINLQVTTMAFPNSLSVPFVLRFHQQKFSSAKMDTRFVTVV